MFEKLIDTLATVLELASADPVPAATDPRNTPLQNIWIESFRNKSFTLLRAHLRDAGYTEPSSLSDFAFLFNEFISTMPQSLRAFYEKMMYLSRPSTVIPTRVQQDYVLWQVYYFSKKLHVLALNTNSFSPDNCCLLDKRVISSERAQLLLNGHADDRIGVPVMSIYVSTQLINPFKFEKISLCLRCLECQLMLELDDEAVINNANWLSEVPVDEVYVDKLLTRREEGAFVKTSNFEIKIWLLVSLCLLFVILFIEFVLLWVGVGKIVSLKNRIGLLEEPV